MTNILEEQRSGNNASDNSEDTIVSRFERQVAAVPDKLAIITDEISLTYRALDLKASHIAAVLASLPCERDRPIALFMKDEPVPQVPVDRVHGTLHLGRCLVTAAGPSRM
jgi:non-ribosomal peptide synthetase component F